MDPYSSPHIIPHNGLHNPFTHSLLSTREKNRAEEPQHRALEPLSALQSLESTYKHKHVMGISLPYWAS